MEGTSLFRGTEEVRRGDRVSFSKSITVNYKNILAISILYVTNTR